MLFDFWIKRSTNQFSILIIDWGSFYLWNDLIWFNVKNKCCQSNLHLKLIKRIEQNIWFKAWLWNFNNPKSEKWAIPPREFAKIESSIKKAVVLAGIDNAFGLLEKFKARSKWIIWVRIPNWRIIKLQAKIFAMDKVADNADNIVDILTNLYIENFYFEIKKQHLIVSCKK